MLKNISINQLSIEKNDQSKKLIDSLSIVINPQNKCAIIGEEGCGKSTLLKWLLNDSSLSDYVICNYHFSNSLKFSYCQQNRIDNTNQSIYDYLFKENDEYNLELFNEFSTITQWMNQLNLDSDQLLNQDILVNQLSLGMKAKIVLIKTFIKSYDVLLLDEPTNDLDTVGYQWLIQKCQNINQPILFVSHDTYFIQQIANQIINIDVIDYKYENIITVYKGDYLSFIENKQKQYATQMQRYTSITHHVEAKEQKLKQLRNKIEHQQNQCVRNPTLGRTLAKKMKTIDHARLNNFNKTIQKPLKTNTIDLKFDDIAPCHRKVILNIDHQSLKIGSKLLLSNYSLILNNDSKIIITGENGCGKTTLIKEIVKRLDSNLNIAYMPQDYLNHVNINQTAYTFLLDNQQPTAQLKSKIYTYLSALNLSVETIESPLYKLSLGTIAKCYLAKLILCNPNILLLDEPTRNLSPVSYTSLLNLLNQYQGCILLICHDQLFIDGLNNFKHYEFINQQLILR